MLDYEHLPFRCNRCHKTGHLARDFPLGHQRKCRQRKQNRKEKASVSVQDAGLKEDETGPTVLEIPSSPMVNVDQAPEDAAGPSSLPIEDLADSLVPLQVAELVGASQVGMSSSCPLLHQSSACLPFVDCSEPGPSR